MGEHCAFRQVEEKHVTAEVSDMLWSPRMDLLAVALATGEVVLHRLSWQKVWTLAPPADEVKVTALAWRPDGKVLAIGYSTGKVTLCDVENSTQLHSLDMTIKVTCMAWISHKTNQEQTEAVPDTTSKFLPNLPQFSKSYASLVKGQSEDNMDDCKKLKDQTELNLLVVGTESGELQLYAFGIFPVGMGNFDSQGIGQPGRVLSGHLSSDLHLLTLVVEVNTEDDEHTHIYLMALDTTLLASHHVELKMLALKFGHILTLMAYLESTLQQMQEAWEDILLEMDSKLAKFAEEKFKACSGCVSNDFLHLLMLGRPSDELKNFLLHELTEKGLKKLGHSIETSYSNIQKLVLKHLHSVGQALVFHLSEVEGMSDWYDKYGVLGLASSTVSEAVCQAGSFMLKASELQQVIDGSMKNFKAFFRWLYVVIQRMCDEPIPQELSKMTQQQLNFVAQFLKESFTEEMDGKSTGFKLEKVGQYLKNEDLSDPLDNSSNSWVKFLESCPTLKESNMLYPDCKEKSLLQVHQQLIDSIGAVLGNCGNVIGRSLQCVSADFLFRVECNSDENENPLHQPKFAQFTRPDSASEEGKIQYEYTVFTQQRPSKFVYVTRQATIGSQELEAFSFKIGELAAHRHMDTDMQEEEKCKSHIVLDLAHYDENTLSLLLQEDNDDRMPVLAQLDLNAVGDESFIGIPARTAPLVDCTELPVLDVGTEPDEIQYRCLENMRAAAFAVSGTRKVACVLFNSLRRVRLFMMDAEDDDDEDSCDLVSHNTTHNTTIDSANVTSQYEDEDKENTSREIAMIDID